MKTSQNGVSLITSFEGFSSKPYADSGGVATIGFGSTRYADGRKVTLKDAPISREEGMQLFALTLPKYEQIVQNSVKVPLNQNQFDALVAFTYNTGGSANLFSLVNKKDAAGIKAYWQSHYTTAGGKVLSGLIRRRKAEADLFFTGIK